MEETIRPGREIVFFLAVTFALSSILYFLIISSGSLLSAGIWYPFLLMWCPGVAALFVSLIRAKTIRGLGWGWGRTRYQLLAWLLPPGYALLAYGSVWLFGLGGVTEGLSRNWLAWIVLGTVTGCFAALGEEIGWRGFLVPRLARVTNFTKTSLISGLIWAFWHLPLILFADYNAGTPGWYGLLCFTVMAVAASFAYAWLRLKSGSVWTAMFLHASHNLWIQSFFDPMTTDTGITEYLIGEFGAALALVLVGVAFVFWVLRGRLDRADD